MPTILDPPPPAIAAELRSLSRAVDAQVPARRPDNILIATWNIRAFASLTREWRATGNMSPKRDLTALRAIGGIVRRFDVVAIQEVKGDLRALRDMMKLLGDDWAFLMTDVTLGDAGNDERLAFVFDTTRVKPSGLAAEIVVPPEWIATDSSRALKRQFARTPYAISLKAGSETFILVTAHIDYSKKAQGRIPELKGIAEWMADWAVRTNRWEQNLLVLGDFNIDRVGDPLWQAFTSTGLTVPAKLHEVPRTLFSDPAHPSLDKFYDQIAWFESGAKRALTMTCEDAGYVDFTGHLYADPPLSTRSLSYRISDHYPLWTCFRRGHP